MKLIKFFCVLGQAAGRILSYITPFILALLLIGGKDVGLGVVVLILSIFYMIGRICFELRWLMENKENG